MFGYEKYNDTKCVIGKFVDSELTVEIWLDAKRGTCLKTVNIGIDSTGENYEIVNEFIATYDIVTDEDVKKPDLTGYTMIENDVN